MTGKMKDERKQLNLNGLGKNREKTGTTRGVCFQIKSPKGEKEEGKTKKPKRRKKGEEEKNS